MTSSMNQDEFPNQLSSVDRRLDEEQRHRHNLWRSNFHEAAIYIEEGLNNDKFENHPRRRTNLPKALLETQDQQQTPTKASYGQQTSLIENESSNNKSIGPHTQSSPLATGSASQNKNGYLLGGQYTTIETYILVHNRYFYQLDLAASVVLLMLALFEPPAVEGYELNTTVHAAIEMFALGIMAIELLLKFRWMGPRRFFRHGRTVTKLLVLLTMNIEAIIIFSRHSMHSRYSRALRPIFLIDNHYCHGMRRAVRQIFQSLPPIIDMFTLALFFMFVFSIFGFYLFAPHSSYFSNMPTTVGNLLIMATTASLPDVMMPSYAVTRWSTIFFVLFIVIHVFLLTNLTMAAVYETFTRKEKEKFHKLLLHRRKACKEAFKLLVSRRQPNRIQYRQFMGLMRYLNRKCSMFDAYLIFKALDTDKSGSISQEEFYQIYDFINLEWKLINPANRWYDDIDCIPQPIINVMDYIARIVEHRYFDWTIDFLIATQAVLQFIEASTFQFDADPPIDPTTLNNIIGSNPRPDSVSTWIFISIFALEAVLRFLTMGCRDYWSSRWNRFDFIILTLSICGLIAGQLGSTPFGWFIVIRILRLMRLFEFKRRYKDMWQTLTYILLKRFVSMTCVVMILYYFFAILGMELLGNYDLRNCCKNTTLESQFRVDNSTETARYYLNDFGDLIASYLTLFSMTSNTYWLATMTAYSIVSGSNYVRIYFSIYYLCSIIVMNIVIAFILESFLFRIHYRNKMGDNCDDTNLFTVSVALAPHEIEFLRKNLRSTRFRRDRNLEQMLKLIQKSKFATNTMERKNSNDGGLFGLSGANDQDIECTDDERVSLLANRRIGHKSSTSASKQTMGNIFNSPSRDLRASATAAAAVANAMRNSKYGDNAKQLADHSIKGRVGVDYRNQQAKQHSNGADSTTLLTQHTVSLLIYQAEQIRNKFSFTMKMYADEVENWLAEAAREDQESMTNLISRNQVRAEHVAMARLVRRSIADVSLDANWPRGRSWSSSSGLVREQNQHRFNDADDGASGSTAGPA